MIPKPDFCQSCPINHVTSGYVPLKLREGAILGVGEASGADEIISGEGFSGGAGQWLRNLLKGAGKKWDTVSTLNVLGCKPPDNIFPTDPKWSATSREVGQAGVNYCIQHHLWPGVAKANRPQIYAIGGQALKALTGKEGITAWRGSPLPLLGTADKPRIIPTIHPAALMRQAKLSSVVVGDFRKSFTLPPEKYNLTPSLGDLQAFNEKAFAFDLEWDKDGQITVCGLSSRFFEAIVIPWHEPYLEELRRIFENATDLIGHNIICADLPYIERMGWDISMARIHDTMLKQHLVQPDYPHSLAFVASILTNKVFWKGRWEEEESQDLESPRGQQWKTWDKAWALPRHLGGYGGCQSAQEAFALYNGRDSDAEFQINTPLTQLLNKHKLSETYENVSVPIAYITRKMGDYGLKLDTHRLKEVRQVIEEEIEKLEKLLPHELKPYNEVVGCNLIAPPGTYKTKIKICKGSRKNKHECVKLVFNQPGSSHICPVCQRIINSGKMGEAKVIRGTRAERVIPYNSASKIAEYAASLDLKEVLDSKTNRPTTGKKARKVWAKKRPEFTLLGGLKKQVTLKNNFAKDTLLLQDRMLFNLLVHGTAEGRLSSTGKRKGIDLNIQNQPGEFKIIYIPDYLEWGFVSLDIVQGENMLTTWLAQDWERWERLQQPGYNEHADFASDIFGRQIKKGVVEDKPFYDVGKIFNHSKNYGAGTRKQQEILAEHGYDHFTNSDLQEFNSVWEKKNAKTALWQKVTIEEGTRVGQLRNPFGRVRWFSSRDSAAKMLAFLPASTLADMVLRMMIAHFPQDPRCSKAIQNLGLTTYLPLVDGWRMAIQVHDELVHQGPWETHREQAERSKMIMEQEFRELPGFRFKTDIKASPKSWGDCKKLEV
jgi:uracil-DNA glycosylase family 4